MGEVAGRRREYLDWLRGVAVLIMIEAHTLDAWTRPADRASDVYQWAILLGGMGAPLFLLLAGVSSVLAATSRAAALGSDAAAAATVRRRGGWIFLYAFLFRLQSFVLDPGAALSSLLKVDILNIMGPSIVGTALLWQAVRGWMSRLLLFCAVTAAIAMVTPLVRASPWVHALPDPVEWYLRPVPDRTNFTLLPWAGFVTAGAAVGVCLSRTAPGGGGRTMAALGAAGLATALAGYVAAYLPPLYPQTNFWTSSPTFFFLRSGVLVASIAAAWAWERLARPGEWSPLRSLGRESLFVYWIHVEMVYGVLTLPLHRRLPLPWALAAFLAFTALMLGAVGIKHGVEDRLRRRRQPAATA